LADVDCERVVVVTGLPVGFSVMVVDVVVDAEVREASGLSLGGVGASNVSSCLVRL
jgi:hypothetical protein